MKEEKEILKKHITSNFGQEIPSMDFTELVMRKVENSLENKVVAEPLISKKVWLITTAVSFFVVLTSFGIEAQELSDSWFSNFKLPNFRELKKTIAISIIMTAVLLLMTTADLIYRKKKNIIQ